MGSGEARHGLADSAFMRGLSFFFSPPPASCQKASSRLSAANSSGPGAGSRARVARRGAGGGRGGARGGRGAARGAGGAGGAGDAGGRRRRRRRRRWLSRRWRRRRSDGAPARPSSSSPPRRRSGAWTSTPSPASPSMCCARRPPAATISTCGAKVRTAYLFCSSHRITSPPVGKRHSMKYWKKSSNPSDLYLGFQMLMMMHLKNITQMWKKRNQKPITNRWVSVSSDFLRSYKNIRKPLVPGTSQPSTHQAEIMLCHAMPSLWWGFHHFSGWKISVFGTTNL
uniref:Maturin, neural progenitor differentiation regulator homolog n=1 Tax=Corvus moneduloides TaxID=1196302 RepID=A0A8C3DET7_CORMO